MIAYAGGATSVSAELTNEGESGVEGPLSTSVNTGGLKKLKGGTGGRVLSLNILPVRGKPKLVVWALTTGSFAASRG
jgi:hypothetical protein